MLILLATVYKYATIWSVNARVEETSIAYLVQGILVTQAISHTVLLFSSSLSEFAQSNQTIKNE